MTKSIQEIEEEIVDEFSLFDEWMEKYEFIIEMGQNLPGLPDSDKTADHIVHGCQSQVWLWAEMIGDRLIFRADSDAIITKGLIAMLIRVLSQQTPQEVLEAKLAFIDRIGMREHLSPTRSNGLNAMIKKMKNYALAFSMRHPN
ncbi:MAG: SufE family protein [Bacteroidia bacterium]|nr:SufE family protein [Bacteroidia bacterium]